MKFANILERTKLSQGCPFLILLGNEFYSRQTKIEEWYLEVRDYFTKKAFGSI